MKDLFGIARWIFLESCSSWMARVFVPAVAMMFLVVSVAGADEVELAGGDVLRDLSLTAGVTHEYQSVVDPGNDKNDLRVFTGLQYDF